MNNLYPKGHKKVTSKKKICWCLKQKNGIEFVELKDHLSLKYMQEAEDSLDACMKNIGKWKLITGYYACYNSLYSLLMKCGIKCEIHDCTINLMEFFGFNEEEIRFMEDLKSQRIRAQYYLENLSLDGVHEIKKFILKCKEILGKLNSLKIEEIRNKIKGGLND